MVIDCFTYNGEKDILDLRLNILDEFVDYFIICEARTTFSGNPKPLYFFRDEQHFKKWFPKLRFYQIKDSYTPEEIALAELSPNTKGAKHWKREFLQKERIHRALIDNNVKDDDIVYIGDVDEIWEPFEPSYVTKLKLRVYAYYLNNASSEEFWGPIVSPYACIKDKVLNHVRSDTTLRSKYYSGWHFTSMGGTKEVSRKLNDSYTAESYNTPQVQQLLQSRVEQGMDYLGRPFQFKLDESKWPDYLKQNKEKYKHLLKL